MSDIVATPSTRSTSTRRRLGVSTDGRPGDGNRPLSTHRSCESIHPELASLATVYDPSDQNMQVFIADLEEALRGTDIELVEATIAGTRTSPRRRAACSAAPT